MLVQLCKLYYCRRELDLRRGLDRYECTIFQSAEAPTPGISLVESAAAVLERSSQIEIVSLNTSGIYGTSLN